MEYPRKGIWAIAFISTAAKGEIRDRIPVGRSEIAVFLPTTRTLPPASSVPAAFGRSCLPR